MNFRFSNAPIRGCRNLGLYCKKSLTFYVFNRITAALYWTDHDKIPIKGCNASA